MAKFSVFETAQEVIYRTLRNVGYPRESMSEGMQLVVSLNSGIIAGLAAAIVSQPADTVLSKINQVKTEGSTAKAIVTIMKQLGVRRLFLGIGPRCLMVGWLTAGRRDFFIQVF
jgi:solute carrier family 25 phosphate transporter 3